MTTAESVVTIAVVVLGTMITRFLPFILFPSGKKLPEQIRYLGGMLPYAIMGLLLVFSLKDVSFLSGNRGIPEGLAIAYIVVVHRWKKNMFLSMGSGTILYMFLVQRIWVG